MNNDLISRSALKKAIAEATYNFEQIPIRVDEVQEIVDNAPTAEKDYDIVFLCDGKACGENHDCMECRHTLDIRHAKNFHYNPILFDKNYYLEVENGQSDCSSDGSDT